jgi:hypothetical protein
MTQFVVLVGVPRECIGDVACAAPGPQDALIHAAVRANLPKGPPEEAQVLELHDPAGLIDDAALAIANGSGITSAFVDLIKTVLACRGAMLCWCGSDFEALDEVCTFDACINALNTQCKTQPTDLWLLVNARESSLVRPR